MQFCAIRRYDLSRPGTRRWCAPCVASIWRNISTKTGIDDRPALRLYREIAGENRSRRDARDFDWQGRAFSLDPATYGEWSSHDRSSTGHAERVTTCHAMGVVRHRMPFDLVVARGQRLLDGNHQLLFVGRIDRGLAGHDHLAGLVL
jgi:hypothetical protein